jgi:hypothetical protein
MAFILKKGVIMLGIGILIFLFSGYAQLQMMKKFNSGTPVFEKDRSVVPIDLKGHPIYVKAKINDTQKEYKFILDTGGPTIIDERLAKELNLEKGEELPMGQEGGKAYLTRKGIIIGLGDLKVKDFIVVVADLPEILHPCPNVDGFIGSDFLRFFQVTIDYRQKRIVLSRSDYPLEPVAGAYEADIQLLFPFRFPLVKYKVDEDIEAQAMLDTGSPFAVVFPLSLIERQKFTENNKPIKSKGLIAKWPFTSADCNYIARVKSIKIGALEIQDIPVLYAELPGNVSYSLLGNDFLSHFLITIDYPKNKLFMLPYGDSEFKKNLFSTGLGLVKDESDRTLVQGFWEGSPADKGGIQLIDEVLEINSRGTKDLTLREINKILENDMIETVELLIRGPQGEKKLALRKEMLFPEIKNK